MSENEPEPEVPEGEPDAMPEGPLRKGEPDQGEPDAMPEEWPEEDPDVEGVDLDLGK